jgi:putative sterol carrier protein
VAASVSEFFDTVATRFRPEQARGVAATVQFCISGPAGGDWQARIDDGALTVQRGLAASPDATVTTSDEVWLGIVNGSQSATGAFFSGRLQLTGDMQLALRLPALFSMS